MALLLLQMVIDTCLSRRDLILPSQKRFASEITHTGYGMHHEMYNVRDVEANHIEPLLPACVTITPHPLITCMHSIVVLYQILIDALYMCPLTFDSSEHAYQFRACEQHLRPDLAEKILHANTPRDAKSIAAVIKKLDPSSHWIWLNMTL